MAGLIQELKRRNVFKVGAAYAVMAWLLAQGVDVFLENFGAPPWVIKTVLLLLVAGFPVALLFAWAFELTPEGLKKEKDVDRSQSITSETGRKLDFLIIGILVVALGWFAWDKFAEHGSDPISQNAATAQSDVGSEQSDPTPVSKSIAVLPFVNMSEDANNEYFSDGVSEEILNALAKVKDLKVAGRTSSFAFKGQNQDLRQIGQALGVEHILEGSVRKSGNTIRITAQLIQVSDGFHLWSDTYDRELTDVFAIQDEIANAILEQLKAQLMGEQQTEVAVARADTKAYDLYLLAKQRLYERTGPTIKSAAELLDQAIALDPNYAPAYAQRGIAALILSAGTGTYGDTPRADALAQGKLNLDKALQLDPNLAEAWAGMGLYYVNQPTNETEEAIKALEKALSINPGLIDASNWLSNALESSGNPAESQRVLMDMIERDPLYRPGVANVTGNLIVFGQQEQALARLEQIRPLIPNDAVIQTSEAMIYQSMGESAKVLQLTESAMALQPSNSVARLNHSFALMDSYQYERVVEEGVEWLPVLALTYLDRREEASQLAFKRAEQLADVGTLFTFLNITNRSDELVAYLEERWPDLDALRRQFPPYSGLGDFLMLDVALAYSRTGNDERFNQAMQMAEKTHQQLVAQGVNNYIFFMSEAARLALAGNLDGSMDYLERAVAGGATTSKRMAFDWPQLAPLEGDPRFEAIQARMIEHVNTERQKLGLEPVTI